MHDARFEKLATLLVEYSTRLKRNEHVLIEAFDTPDEMTIALIRAARKAGAIPFVQVQRAQINREMALKASDPQLNFMARHELARMKKMDAYIALRGSNNITELSDVPVNQIVKQLIASTGGTFGLVATPAKSACAEGGASAFARNRFAP